MCDVSTMCTVSMGKLGYKSVRIIRFLGIISKQTKSFHLVAQHQWVNKSENLHTVLWDYSDLNFTREFMQSGYPGYEPLINLSFDNKIAKSLQCPNGGNL